MYGGAAAKLSKIGAILGSNPSDGKTIFVKITTNRDGKVQKTIRSKSTFTSECRQKL